MFCNNCGQQLANEKFCTKCGTPTSIENSGGEQQTFNQKTSQLSRSNTGVKILGLITGIILIVIIVLEDLIFHGSDVDYYVPLYWLLFCSFIVSTPFGILIFLIRYFRNRKKGITLMYCAKKAFSYIIMFTLFWGGTGYNNQNLNMESMKRRGLIGSYGYYSLSTGITLAALLYFLLIFIKYISHRKKGIYFEAYEKRINIAVQIYAIVEVLIVFIWFVTT